MDISQFTIQLIFIFTPGFISIIISDRLTTHRERKPYEFLVYAFIAGCASHIVYFIVYTVLQRLGCQAALPYDSWLDDVLTRQNKVQGVVLLINSIIGGLIGLFVAYGSNHSLLHRFSRCLNITKKFSDLDVWGYLMNSGATMWVVIRRPEQNIMYQGYIAAFSDEEDQRELLLSDVTIYDNDSGDQIYTVATCYLSFKKDEVSIEIYEVKNEKQL